MISNDEQTQKNAQKLNYRLLNGIGDSDVSLVKPEIGGLMHMIDRLTVITGSYNWTYYADNKNHENIGHLAKVGFLFVVSLLNHRKTNP